MYSKVPIIISKKIKIYQKKDRSKNDKNKIVGSFQVSIPREVVNALRLKERDHLVWIVNKERTAAIVTTP